MYARTSVHKSYKATTSSRDPQKALLIMRQNKRYLIQRSKESERGTAEKYEGKEGDRDSDD